MSSQHRKEKKSRIYLDYAELTPSQERIRKKRQTLGDEGIVSRLTDEELQDWLKAVDVLVEWHTKRRFRLQWVDEKKSILEEISKREKS